LIKGSKDSDSSLVSNENLGEILWLVLRLGPRSGNMSQNGPKSASLMTSLAKNLQLSTEKFFFHCRLEELLNLFRVWTALYHFHLLAEELWHW